MKLIINCLSSSTIHDILCKSNLVFTFHLVIGALIGKQTGRNVEVMNSFELKFKYVDENIIICRDYYLTKEEQCEYFFLFVCFFLNVNRKKS